MTCPRDPNGVHRKDYWADICKLCGASAANIVESKRQPLREAPRAVAGAGAFGRTAVDIAARRAGDCE